MENAPFISVVMPCYRLRERFSLFIQAAHSVFKQSYTNFELVLVNDASPDNTSELLKNFIDSHPEQSIQLINLEQNSGPSVARNEGIKNAEGQLVAFLDFDDIYLPHFLENAARAYEQDKSLRVVLGATLYYRRLLGMERVFLGPIEENINQQSLFEQSAEALKANFPVAMGSAVVCKKSLFTEAPQCFFDEFLSKRTAEDVLFGYQFLKAGHKPLYLQEPQVIHRTFYTHLSRSNQAYLSGDELEVYEYILEHAKKPLLQAIETDKEAEILANWSWRLEDFALKNLIRDLSFHNLGELKGKRLKSIVRFLLLKWSNLYPLSFIRNCYYFLVADDNPTLRKETSEYIKEL